MSPFFIVLALVTLAGACAAMTLRNLVHCALAVAVAFAGIGALYLNLGSQFLGLAQLLVYVGAVAVLIVFVILLTQPPETNAMTGGLRKAAVETHGGQLLSGLLVAASLFGLLGYATLHSFAAHAPNAASAGQSIRQLGTMLMEHYILPLEVIGLLLTAAMIGAVVLAMKETANTR